MPSASVSLPARSSRPRRISTTQHSARCCSRITLLIEKSYGAIGDFPSLISEQTGELHGSLRTIGQLISHQHKLLLSLGRAPTVMSKIAKEDAAGVRFGSRSPRRRRG
jgi:hypothetical protein